jgi:pimeloyl-ACP methyl ester carboxylesterase
MSQKAKIPSLLKFVRWVFPRLERIAPPLAHLYFLKIFFTPLRYRTPDKERKAETFAKKFTLQIGGKKIQGYSWGNAKEYVLLIHGWAGRTTQFRRFIKPLKAANFKVIGFDGPAHGNSQGKKTNILEFEETLKKIYEKFGVPVAIVAHSFGGVATLYATMNGLPLKKLINIASPTIGDEVIKTYLRAVNGSWETGKFFKSYMVKTYGKSFDEFSSLYFIERLPHPIDLLLVHDENDKEVIIQHSEELAKRYPYAMLVRTKGLGHTRILKDDSVIRRCVTFITDNVSG